MTNKVRTGIALLAVALLGAPVYWWVHDAPRRQSLESLSRLDFALHSTNRAALLQLVVIPAGVRGVSAAEQTEFLSKALNEEVSAEGIAMLKQQGAYGPLRELFPAEAESWATQAGVSVDECVAFKMERRDLRAEVALVKPSPLTAHRSTGEAPYRILRVNNVRQMAEPATVATLENKP